MLTDNQPSLEFTEWFNKNIEKCNQIYSEMAHLLGVAQSVTRKISHRSRGFQPRE